MTPRTLQIRMIVSLFDENTFLAALMPAIAYSRIFASKKFQELMEDICREALLKDMDMFYRAQITSTALERTHKPI